MNLGTRNSELNLGQKEKKIATRKYKKLDMEKKRRNRFNRLLNELQSIVLKGMGRDKNSRFTKFEKTDILDITLKYLRYLRLQSSKLCSSDAHIQIEKAHREVIDFLTKCERGRNTATATKTPAPTSPCQRPATNSSPSYADPHTFTHPAMTPVTLPYLIDGQIIPNNLDTTYTTYTIESPIPSANSQPIVAHLVKNEYIPYGYDYVSTFAGNFAQAIGDVSVYSPPPLPRYASPKVWRPWTFY